MTGTEESAGNGDGGKDVLVALTHASIRPVIHSISNDARIDLNNNDAEDEDDNSN